MVIAGFGDWEHIWLMNFLPMYFPSSVVPPYGLDLDDVNIYHVTVNHVPVYCLVNRDKNVLFRICHLHSLLFSAIMCPALDIPNASLHLVVTDKGLLALVECITGSRMPDGTRRRTLLCTDNGEWHTTGVTCKRTCEPFWTHFCERETFYRI